MTDSINSSCHQNPNTNKLHLIRKKKHPHDYHHVINEEQQQHEEDSKNGGNIMSSFFNMLPSFANASSIEQLKHMCQAVDQRLMSLEKRFAHDKRFKDERIQGLEGEITQRISLLEMQLSQLRSEMRAKDELYMRHGFLMQSMKLF